MPKKSIACKIRSSRYSFNISQLYRYTTWNPGLRYTNTCIYIYAVHQISRYPPDRAQRYSTGNWTRKAKENKTPRKPLDIRWCFMNLLSLQLNWEISGKPSTWWEISAPSTIWITCLGKCQPCFFLKAIQNVEYKRFSDITIWSKLLVSFLWWLLEKNQHFMLSNFKMQTTTSQLTHSNFHALPIPFKPLPQDTWINSIAYHTYPKLSQSFIPIFIRFTL